MNRARFSFTRVVLTIGALVIVGEHDLIYWLLQKLNRSQRGDSEEYKE